MLKPTPVEAVTPAQAGAHLYAHQTAEKWQDLARFRCSRHPWARAGVQCLAVFLVVRAGIQMGLMLVLMLKWVLISDLMPLRSGSQPVRTHVTNFRDNFHVLRIRQRISREPLMNRGLRNLQAATLLLKSSQQLSRTVRVQAPVLQAGFQPLGKRITFFKS